MTERMVVVGGDAAGMSAASQAKRLRGDRLEVIAFERGAHSSYSACGIPYWVAGDVPDGEQLVARTPEAHRANGIDLRMLTDVEAIDVQGGTVAVRDLASGRRYPAATLPASSACRPSTMAPRSWPAWNGSNRSAPWSSGAATSVWRWPRRWPAGRWR
jgi:NADPH-dependent 2,4-dienoyl-CoA reductase/sulfur reductase-like enzyme